jgi:hypothetical protein
VACLSLLGCLLALDFGPCPLFPLNLKTTNADIFSPSKSQSNSLETVTNSKLEDLK